MKSMINSETMLWSVEFPADMIIKDEGFKSEKLFHHCLDTVNEHSDAHLHFSGQGNIELLKKYLMKAHNMQGEIVSVRSVIEGRFSEMGNLISMRGDITDVHIYELRKNPNRRDHNLCVHVCDGPLIVSFAQASLCFLTSLGGILYAEPFDLAGQSSWHSSWKCSSFWIWARSKCHLPSHSCAIVSKFLNSVFSIRD